MVYEQFDSQAASLVGISTSVATRRLNIYSKVYNELSDGRYELGGANNPVLQQKVFWHYYQTSSLRVEFHIELASGQCQ